MWSWHSRDTCYFESFIKVRGKFSCLLVPTGTVLKDVFGVEQTLTLMPCKSNASAGIHAEHVGRTLDTCHLGGLTSLTSGSFVKMVYWGRRKDGSILRMGNFRVTRGQKVVF